MKRVGWAGLLVGMATLLGCTAEGSPPADGSTRSAAMPSHSDASGASSPSPSEAPTATGPPVDSASGGPPLAYAPDLSTMELAREALRPLGNCTRFNRAPVVELVGGDPGEADLDALERAIAVGDTETASSVRSSAGPDHLVLAAATGCTELIEVILQADVNANAKHSAQGWTPLDRAVRSRNDAAVALLLENGADATARNVDDETPLHLAAGWGSLDMVERLLAAGADPNAVDVYGTTPLTLAGGSDAPEILVALLTAGGQPRPKDLAEMAARLPSLTGTDPSRVKACIALLLEAGVDPDDPSDGTSAIETLRQQGHLEAVEYIRHYAGLLEEGRYAPL